ncbi:ArsR family transcriptional regulator [Halorutilales archaeon Cl-col2-1]
MSETGTRIKEDPLEEQRQLFDLLSQETRHQVVRYILGHPKHLMSLDELDYMIPKSKGAIDDQLDNLIEEGILDLYEYPPNKDKRDLPSRFYGFTERGIQVLRDYQYLNNVPVLRAVYDNTKKSEKLERHQDAPRPELPETVEQGLSL